MLIITTAKEMLQHAIKQREKELKIGFIPTMGALHEGHLSLIETSKSENDITVCSIFVNPTQFNEANDFNKYPRQIDADLLKLKTLRCDVVFVPDVKEIYPQPDTIQYDLGVISEIIEGEHRPGHFNGVASVVKRLFEIVIPHNAYFGLKDYQQFLLVKELCRRYGLNVNIIGCPIIREESGLAMSSRNQLLSQKDKEIASNIYKSLLSVKNVVHEYNYRQLESLGVRLLSSSPEIDIEYFLVVDKETLMPPTDKNAKLIALVAVRVGEVRLIDNMFL